MNAPEPAVAASIPDNVLSVDDWNSKSNTKFFRRYEGPFRLRKIQMANHPVRRVLERQFEYMSRNLYFISAFGRFMLSHTQEDKILQAEEIAENTINNAINSMKKRIDQARIVLESAGNSDEGIEYSKKLVLEVPITTKAAGLYAKLLEMTDEFYTLNYMIWCDGEIDNRAKFANESEARTEVQRVVRGIASQFNYILKLTNTKDEKEARKAGTHDEAGLENSAVEAVDQAMGNDAMTSSVITGDGDDAHTKDNEGVAATPAKPKRTKATTKAEPATA